MTLLTFFDFYGININFTIKRDTKFRTIPGTIISFFILGLIILISYLFINYFSNNFTIKSLIQIDKTLNASPAVSLQNNILSGYLIYWDDSILDPEFNKKVFNITATLYERDVVGLTKLTFGSCLDVFNSTKVTNIERYNLSSFSCIIPQIGKHVAGAWDENNKYSFLTLDTQICNKTFDKNCLSELEIKGNISTRNPYFKLIFLDSFNNFSNKDQPFVNHINTIEIPINFNTDTELMFNFGQDIIIDDNGFLMNPSYSDSLNKTTTKMKQLYWFNYQRSIPSFLRIYYESCLLSSSFYRIPVKLYEVSTFMIVFIKIVISLGEIVNNNISGFLLKNYLSEKLFYYDENLLDKEKIPKILSKHYKKTIDEYEEKSSSIFKNKKEIDLNPLDNMELELAEQQNPQNIIENIDQRMKVTKSLRLTRKIDDSIMIKKPKIKLNELIKNKKILNNSSRHNKFNSLDVSKILQPDIHEKDDALELGININEISKTQKLLGKSQFFHLWEKPIFYIFKGLVRICCTDRLHYKHLLLEKSYKILDDYLDIEHLLNKIIQIDFLKFVLLDHNQIKLLKFINKPEISLINSINVHSFSRIYYDLKDTQFQDIYHLQRMKPNEIKNFLIAYENLMNNENFSTNDNKLLNSIDKNFRYLSRFIKR